MSRLFIISNRLPITIEKNGENYFYRPSSGGLVSAISAYLGQEANSRFTRKVWVGVSDCSEKLWKSADSGINAEYEFMPVFVSPKHYEQYYDGFSNSVLWPLFHYFPSFADYQPSFFEGYHKVNAKFAEELEQTIDARDTVWIHDYHLLPLAGMLREKFPQLTIGFFLHIPFPSYELFRVIPREWQHELINGMLGADVIGFHTEDYLEHFLTCVQKVMKVTVQGRTIRRSGRDVRVGAFPIGIDFKRFHEGSSDRAVLLKRSEYLRSKQDKKLIFSVDRLDYSKGVFNRLKGYGEFLVQNPHYKEKVVFALVIVPSRDSIRKYAERKKMIDEYIGNLNSRLGNINWQPVMYQYGHLSFEELLGLYTACDLALITPIRDGMNLVAKEFVASRRDKQGVLVLSEMAGAANQLAEALLINPNDRREISRMIKVGLEMSPDEQESRMTAMQESVRSYDVVTWAKQFFTALDRVSAEQIKKEPLLLDNFAKAKMFESYAGSTKRLILLDYDGTLSPFFADPQMASPSTAVLQVLQELSNDPVNKVYIVSGRDSDSLENWLGHLPLGLIAEHGVKMRHAGGDWQVSGSADIKVALHDIAEIMRSVVNQCPGSFIEQKDFSIAWHYRNAEINLASIKAGQLLQMLREKADLSKLSILNGHKVIEVKGAATNKGEAIAQLLNGSAYDFILCAGDDQTDEDMFLKLKDEKTAFTIKVGSEPSMAHYNLLTPYLIQELLERLSAARQTHQQFEL
ncbi:bifunctional alpha,alpha-trehalose-phosphate synthase (UDP-forming)/trehalose-phosphatase [Mucilaginibacter aquariorum]|uniref:Bifunctional alpha,alpha-trehalose-phosphate synthase (UDP-forming)/trehalose-phosphatase n=1 Tax=Mucilaginibacter aquariorum TaxID=2967225 RepID=A0ABT1T3J4_9SPHI|nr:bifunctional alpha,alpha-trehalose-phosphate synthase (UDP-forming)/trehalose-phosphatase [Mucilaginibacter aquariorum]MCQ6959176.1 bifunctional alpha,alpha-trehalose-phosphate synthase (UDP-forming)/trehalose-phosphatase [Mucilaginibacter aquariorum]